jgi:hypothetical protein
LVAASELDLQELVNHLQSFLINNNTTWMEKNFSVIYQTSFENNSLLELQNYCIDIISKKPDKIFNSLNFSSIPEKILISIIQNDNLKMNEVQVWKHVLKWGLNQNPGLPSDPESFSVDDFSALKSTLQQCIPLIKFDNFSSKEFLDNVFPYREILSEKLFIDLLKLFLDHDHKLIGQPEPEETKEIKPETQIFEKIETESTNVRNIPNIMPQMFKEINETKSTNYITTSINSSIITPNHAKLISKWINRLNTNALYEFRLILSGTRNGFKGRIFHEICDNKPRTLTIIRVSGSGEVLGGYNPIAWKTGGYSATHDSFIFSFKSTFSIQDYILSRVKDHNFAISNHSDRGPSFGVEDLVLRGKSKRYNNSVCKLSSYEKPIRKTNSKFSVDEYEVFQIIEV